MACARLALALIALAQHGATDAKDLEWVEGDAVPQDKVISLRFFVKLTHTHDLKEILGRVSDPDSPDYGHYMSKAQVDALTKPTPEHIAAVKSLLQGYDVQVEDDNAVIFADVPNSFAQQLIGGKFVYFCHPSIDGGSENVCAVRNPTAKVPAKLRDACDIISPIDDPLPPIRPFPGPIIEPVDNSRPPLRMSMAKTILAQNIEPVAEQEQPAAVCCYSIGYGAMMKPCCLSTQQVSEAAMCREKQQVGGSSSYSMGKCPASSDEAAAWIQQGRNSKTAAAAMVQPPGAATGCPDGSRGCWNQKQYLAEPSKSISVAATPAALAEDNKKQQSATGCCFSLGYGSMMKPCCLETYPFHDVSSCLNFVHGLGGSSGYSLGSCPATAEDAAEIVKSQQKVRAAPAVEAQQALMQEAQADLSTGCCFSFGYGAMMKPCCLKAESTHDTATCKSQRRIGGASGFALGSCPASAQQAADMFTAQSLGAKVLKPKFWHSGSSTMMTLFVVFFLAGLGAIVGGVLFAARHRRVSASTPFLPDDGAE